MRRSCVLIATLAIACEPPSAHSAEAKLAALHRCVYAVAPAAGRALTLDVAVRCDDLRFRGLSGSDDLIVRRVRAWDGDGRQLRAQGSTLALAQADESARFHYQIDVDAIADERDDPLIADRVGHSWIAPASTWLLRPFPTPSATRIDVIVRGGLSIATALAPSDGGYSLMAHQVRTATYAVFGRFRQSALEVPGLAGGTARIRLVTLDGRFDLDEAKLSEWVDRSAQSIASFFHGFPTDAAMVALVPTPGDDKVSWGALLPENGSGIAVNIGEHATRRALDGDWILVHELFHIGVPSFIGEGKWLDEGLATYYEPIIRARAGLLSEAEVWSEFARNMPSAATALKSGLEKFNDDWTARYWGGATVVLLADLEARRRSNGARGLEDGLIRVLDAGGDARQIWKLSDVYSTVDAALGAPILAELGERYAMRGADVDFAHLFADLGVVVHGDAVTLSDRAPHAALRRAILRGARAGSP